MPAQTEHRFPPGPTVPGAAGSRVTQAGLRGQARAAAVSVMRTGTCPAGIRHARTPARRTCPPTTRSRPRWYPARRRTPPGSGASPATGSPSCPPPAPRRTRRPGGTGPCSFTTAASCSPARPASRDTGRRPPCPPAAPAAQRRRPRPAGCTAPAILPQHAAKG